MANDEFHKRNATRWESTLHKTLGPVPASMSTWEDPGEILSVVNPFLGQNFNHAHYPTGGGMDFKGVLEAPEPNCIAFEVDTRVIDVVRPKKLILRHFARSPRDSFLLLELAELDPSGVYRNEEISASEELVSVGGRYLKRSVWDDGFYGHDENGSEVPLPAEAKLVIRWLRGKILIVAKGSLWNGTPGTYDGRHSSMSAEDISDAIERALDRRAAAI